jgi:CrcB protein
MIWKNLLLVAIGSGTGGVLRYLFSFIVPSSQLGKFPWTTFLVNLIGCFIIGVIFTLSQKLNLLSEQTRLTLTVGFCGGFTTFSAFAVENVNLFRSGNVTIGFVYILASVALGCLMTFAGMMLIK